MEKYFKHYIGIDVSKLWFDISLLRVEDHVKQTILSERFNNDQQGIEQLNKWLIGHAVAFNDNSLLVMENTGVYHRLIWEYCSMHGLPVHIGNATHIKWSFGIARGKNDKIDSQRLCKYAFKCADELKTTSVLNPVLIKLKDLMKARSRLISQANSTKVFLNELKLSNSKDVHTIMEQAHKAAIEGIKTSIRFIEDQILEIIRQSTEIKNNYELLVSVPGIGHLTAVYIICCTNNFVDRITGKQLASYAGVVPFSNTSGTSVKGRNKVHKMANKELKKMLHMCALSAIQHYPEFEDYFTRKKTEGKHTMAIINAVKNKIVLRAAAVVNNQKKYVDNYKNVA
jgi:transposase